MSASGAGNAHQASWARSQLWGLTPATAMPQRAGPAPDERICLASAPVADALATTISGTGVTVVFGDRHGRVFRAVTGTRTLARRLERCGVEVGAGLSEEVAGNNGIGTVLELRRGVHIRGGEHFADSLKDFCCYGHPIVNPLTGRLEGAVDITGLDSEASALFAPFVRKIVADVEANLVSESGAADRELWRRFTVASRRRDEAVCAFGDEVVLASPLALDLLTHSDLGILRATVSDVCSGRRLHPAGDQIHTTAELSLGTAPVTIEPVGARGGLVRVDLHALCPLAPAIDLGVTGGRDRGAQSAAETEDGGRAGAAPAPRSIVVLAPPGSGATTRARELAGAGAHEIALADLPGGPETWSEVIRPALEAGHPVVVLDDVHLLDPAGLRRLGRYLQRPAAPQVVCTADAVAAERDGDLRSFLARCEAREDLLPLGQRGEELARIAAAVLAELCAARGVAPMRLTPRAVDELAAMDLAAGFVSLRRALEAAAESVDWCGAVDVAQLRSSTREAVPARARHGALARSEYQAVRQALAEAGGVRSRAAKALGISRTTLYARMREFGLD